MSCVVALLCGSKRKNLVFAARTKFATFLWRLFIKQIHGGMQYNEGSTSIGC